jgi:hypothetical protein
MTGTVLNPQAKIRIERQGRELQPVILADDFLAAPEIWRDFAARASYGRYGAYYPGLRAIVPAPVSSALREELAGLIGETFALDPVPAVSECFFSVVTTPPQALTAIQRLPHIDGLEGSRIAILIYLSGSELGGTAFYRQRETGFETVDSARYPAFDSALKTGIARHGLPDAAYIAGDTPLYERIALYEARSNRALIYRSFALHSAAIPPDAPLPADAVRGRLTVNGFLFDAERSE